MLLTIKNLFGVWEFIGSTMKDVKGCKLQDPCNKASGTIVYTDTDYYMAVQLYIPEDDALDKHLRFDDKYLAYYGTYNFNQEEQTVTHHVTNSSKNELHGKLLTRKIRYYADKNCISLQNIEPEKIAMEFPIYRELFWQKLLITK